MEPPMLQLEAGIGRRGNLSGKSSSSALASTVDATLTAAATQRKLNLNGMKVRSEGTLIYHDGKTLLELTGRARCFEC